MTVKKRNREGLIARPFLWIFLAGGAGALLALAFSWWGLTVVFLLGGIRRFRVRPRWFWFLGIGVMAVGCLRLNLHLDWERGIDGEERVMTSILCRVESAEETRGGSLRAILSSEAFRGKVQVYAEDLETGQQILGDLTLKPLENPGNPGEFDRVAYGRIRGIYYEGKLENVSVIREGGGSLPVRWRESLAGRIRNILPEEEAGLLAAILLGEDGFLSEEIEEEFQDVGIAHILAISGLHVGMVYGLLERGLRRLVSPRKAACLAVGCLWFYAALTGGAVSTLRAGILCTVSAGQKLWGGRQDPLNSLAAAAFILLLIHPLYLLDIGFQLSFGCVLALRLLQSVPGRWFFMPPALRERLSPSVAITLAGTPLSLYYFYRVSPYQILLNLLVLPGMSLLFVLGGVTVALSLFWEEAALLPAGGIYLFLRALRFLADQALTWPGAVWTLGRPDVLVLFLYYLGWGLTLAGQNGRRKGTFLCRTGVWGLGLLILLWPESGWRCTFLNVGQGDCAVIEAGNRVYLVDGGPAYESALKPYLRSRGIGKLDGVWISHFDWDHVEGLFILLEEAEIPVEAWYVPAGEWHDNSRLEALYSSGQRVYAVEAGDRVTADNLVFTCLSPKAKGQYEDGNSASMVLRLSDGDTSILFCGDADLQAEEGFAEEAGHCQILKAGHHGSRTSTGEELLRRVQPELTIISCDREGRYGHPHEETLGRLQAAGSEILVTDDVGAVQILVDKRKWTYVTGKAG